MAGERTLPGLGLTGYWNLGDDTWKTGMDENLRVLSGLAQLSVISATTALPGTPADGDVYIVPSDDATNPNKVAVRDNGAWVYYAPGEGWKAWVRDTDVLVIHDGSAWVEFAGSGGGSQYVELSMFAAGTLAAGEVLFSHIPTVAFTLPAGLTGSFFEAGVAATASAVLSVKKGGVQVGTVTFAAGGTSGTLAMASDTSFAAGVAGKLTIVAPGSADATLADVSGSLKGSVN